jgi:hypothetical protein
MSARRVRALRRAAPLRALLRAAPRRTLLRAAPMSALLACVVASARAATCVPAERAGDKLAFDPAANSKLVKAFTIEHHLAMQGLKFSNDGVEQSFQQQMSLTSKQVVRVLDEYKAIADGRPTLLRRTFQESSLHVELQTMDAAEKTATQVLEANSPFEGVSVLFTWVPEESGYGKFYDAKEGVEEYLPALAEDMDLRAVLPGHDVAPGDEWTIEPARVADWVGPSGQHPMQFKRNDEVAGFQRTIMSGIGGNLGIVFGGEVKGKVVARYEGTKAEGDVSLATIVLDVDIETDRDLRAVSEHSLSSAEVLAGTSVARSNVHWKLKGTGRVRWNAAAKRFDSFELGGREEVAFEMRLTTPRGGSNEQSLSMAGGVSVTGATGERARKAKEPEKHAPADPPVEPVHEPKKD